MGKEQGTKEGEGRKERKGGHILLLADFLATPVLAMQTQCMM